IGGIGGSGGIVSVHGAPLWTIGRRRPCGGPRARGPVGDQAAVGATGLVPTRREPRPFPRFRSSATVEGGMDRRVAAERGRRGRELSGDDAAGRRAGTARQERGAGRGGAAVRRPVPRARSPVPGPPCPVPRAGSAWPGQPGRASRALTCAYPASVGRRVRGGSRGHLFRKRGTRSKVAYSATRHMVSPPQKESTEG